MTSSITNWNLNEPDFTSPLDGSLDSIRANYHYLLMVAAHGSVVLPGWNTTVTATDYSEPDTITLTRGSQRIIFNYTWTDGSVSAIQMCYDDGVSSPGLYCFPEIGFYYDDSGNPTGTEPPPSGSNDPLVLWSTEPLETAYFEGSGSAYSNLYFYETGGAGYYLAEPGSWLPREPSIDVSSMPFNTYGVNEYLVKWELVSVESGDGTINATTAEGVWGDAFRYNISIQDTTADDTPTKIILDVTMATNSGASPFAPVPGSESTKRVTMYAGAGSGFQLRDLFSDVTGTAITAHTPTTDATGTASWIQDAGSLEIYSNSVRAEQVSPINTDNRAVIDCGLSDTAIYIYIDFNDEDSAAGLVFRRQDASNYWLLLVDTPISNPVLKLIEVSSGVQTVRDSQAINVAAANLGTINHYMRVHLSGSRIRGQFFTLYGSTTNHERTEENCLTTVSYTSSLFSSESHHGIYSASQAARFDYLEIFDDELGHIF